MGEKSWKKNIKPLYLGQTLKEKNVCLFHEMQSGFDIRYSNSILQPLQLIVILSFEVMRSLIWDLNAFCACAFVYMQKVIMLIA